MTDPFITHLAEALSGSHTVERELFGGGMSRVFVAREKALDRLVVVKVLPPDLAAGVNIERFRREIQVAAQLQHPHIVPLLSAGEHTDLLYYTMPYIEGESLKAILERRGRLTVREVLRILADVADALAYAHDRGVIHRDIKPGNILTLGSHALITDFGVAKALGAALPTTGTTSTGMAIGTPAYMAPEQLAGDPGSDHRVDLYALGLVAYELLAGKAPFEGKSPQATMAAQLTVMPPPLDRSFPDVPPEIAGLIFRCLQKEAADRPRDAKEILRSLEGMATPSGTHSAFFPVPTARRSRTPWIVGGIAAAVGLVASGIMLGRESTPSTPTAPPVQPVADSPVASPVELLRPPDTVYITESGRTPTLSRSDSLRIAAAVEERNRSSGLPALDQRALDSTVAAALRLRLDSLQRLASLAAEAGRRTRSLIEWANPRDANPGLFRSHDSALVVPRPPRGVQRIALGGFAAPDPRLQGVAEALRDSLIQGIRAAGVEVLLVRTGGFRTLMGFVRSRQVNGAMLGTLKVMGEELQLHLTLLHEAGSITISSETLPLDDPLAAVGPLLLKIRRGIRAPPRLRP